MINKYTVSKFVLGVVGVSTMLVGFAFTANAATTANSTAALAKVTTRSDTAITTRIAALNKMSARIAEMKNVPAAEQANISAEVQTETTNLTNLKAKIDADTDVTTARADEKTITGDYRIYALVIPQASIIASSDRVSTIAGMMTALQTKIQTRITADQSAGKDVTAMQTAYADITAKVADASSQAQTAQNVVANLAPDQGNATVAASNKAALLSARADIKSSSTNLKTAREDVKTILAGLKTLK